MKTHNVGSRLALLTVLSAIFLIFTGTFSLYGHARTIAEFKGLYEDRLQALDYLADIAISLRIGAANTVLAFNYDPALPESAALIEARVKEIEEGAKFAQDKWQTYLKTRLTEEEKNLAATLATALENYFTKVVNPSLITLKNKNYLPDAALAYQDLKERESRAYTDHLSALSVLQSAEAKRIYERELANYERSFWLAISIIGIAILGSALGAKLIISSVTNPLQKMRNAMFYAEKNADLTQVLPVQRADEIGQTTETFNALQRALQQMIGHLNTSILKVAQSANSLAKNAGQSSISAASTNESAVLMANAIEEMTSSIHHVGQRSKEALLLAEEAGQLSREGGKVIHETVDEINKIAEVSRDVSTAINDLSEGSVKISSVMEVIKELADQTNLLALNAAIEAARAGEAGRGFSVVADEVRQLAERTKGATVEISATINEIKNNASKAVNVMARAETLVNSGVERANQAGEAISKIRQSAANVVQVVGDISQSIVKQATVSNEIAKQVDEVAKTTAQNTAASENSAESARQLENLAQTMREEAAHFKV